MAKHEQRKEFQKLYLTGKYTQKKLSQMVGVTEATACQWVKELVPLQLFRVRKHLVDELERITKNQSYAENKDVIFYLINEIERVGKLIHKAKYITHLTT